MQLTAAVMLGAHCVVSCVVSASTMSLLLHAGGAVMVTTGSTVMAVTVMAQLTEMMAVKILKL
jgi:hypothetical protein